ncbi:hypothetical protein P7K49_031924, partial [Saguinus oedipus]
VGGHVSRKRHWLPGHIQDPLERGSVQHMRTEAASAVSPKCREPSAWKTRLPLSTTATPAQGRHRIRSWRLSRFFSVTPSSRVVIFSSSPFLRGLTVLYPNSDLEKAATSQIKLHRAFLAPKSDKGNAAHPINRSQRSRHP